MLILFTLFLLKAYPVLIFGNRGSGCSQVVCYILFFCNFTHFMYEIDFFQNCLSPYPENSLASFQDGINSGADMFEVFHVIIFFL